MKKSKTKEKWTRTITDLWPVAKGSLREVQKSCSRSGCKVCGSGGKHSAWLFTFYLDGKQHSKHVPKPMVSKVLKALENGRELEKLIVLSGLDFMNEQKK